jgi:hypothetical protein
MKNKFRHKTAIVIAGSLALSQVQIVLSPQMAYAETQVSDVIVRATAGDGHLSLDWSDPSGAQTLSISAPGVHLSDVVEEGSTGAGGFYPGERITVTIDVRSDVSGSTLEEIVRETGVTETEAVKAFETVELKSLEIVMPVSGVFSTTAVAATQPSATSFRYTTFIPEEKVYDLMVNLCPADFGSYFLGDNRTFDASSTSFRTRVNVRVDWLAGGVVSSTRSAGLSTSYTYLLLGPNFGAYVIDSGYANLNEVTVKTKYLSSTHVVFTLDHNAVDPMCPAAVKENAGIRYHYDVTVQRSGNYGLEGWALRAPAHEAYIRDSESPAWKTVFQRSNSGFGCLLATEFPGCKTEQSYSGAVL